MFGGHIRHGEIVLALPRARNPRGRGWAQRGMQMLCGFPSWCHGVLAVKGGACLARWRPAAVVDS